MLEESHQVFMEAAIISNETQIVEAHTPDDDLGLVYASNNGDTSAFSELVRRYDRRLLRIALNVTHNLEDAEDAVQEGLFKAYQKLDQFHGHAKFSTWLVRIVLNESFIKLRKQRAIEKSVETCGDANDDRPPIELADWVPNPETLYSALEFREILISSLQRLSPALRTVFVLRDIEECSLSETAAILTLTASAVRARLFRARLQLREHLSRYFRKPE